MVEKKTQVEGFDLRSVRTVELANEGVEMEITHPGTGAGLGIYMTVHGEDSENHKRALAKVAQRKEKEQRVRGRTRITPEDIHHSMLITALECTSGWRNFVEDGKPIEFNRANLRRVLTDYWFITEQVNAFLNDRANFIPDSSTSSATPSESE